jgi:hypothetical protein
MLAVSVRPPDDHIPRSSRLDGDGDHRGPPAGHGFGAVAVGRVGSVALVAAGTRAPIAAHHGRSRQAAIDSWSGDGTAGSPAGFDDTRYAIEPRTMIEKTLMTRSRSAIAVASGSETP